MTIRRRIRELLGPTTAVACLFVTVVPAQSAAAQTIRQDARGTIVEVAGWSRPADYVRAADPDLEPGFPVQTFHAGGVYTGGPGVHTLVGNIDDDPQLEIVVSGLGSGYLYAWNHDGTPLPGWPMTAYVGAPYPVLAQISAGTAALEVFTGHMRSPGTLAALDQFGSPLPGWPRSASNYISSPGSAIDVDGDGVAELFICEEDSNVHAYTAKGSALAGWPVRYVPPVGAQQQCATPALGDLDQDGRPEVVTIPGASSEGTWILALHHDGTWAAGFPKLLPDGGYPWAFAVLGDVNGDGSLEIVLARSSLDGSARPTVYIVSAAGEVLGTAQMFGDVGWGAAPVLADLDDDGLPEIIVQTDNALNVIKGDGTPFPGWPQSWPLTELGNSSPVIGDITGDGNPDIAIASWRLDGTFQNEVRVFDAHGNLDPRFPKVLPLGPAATPAIADIDLDGRNELIITGAFWYGTPGYYDKVWAYDLGGGPHGAIHWGQYKADATHRGVYPLGLTPRGLTLDDQTGGDGNGVLEPGERSAVTTRWRNMGTFTRPLIGTITDFTGPAPIPGRYTLEDGSADHGSVAEGATTDCVAAGGDCYAVSVGLLRPVQHWDATLSERLAGGPRRDWRVHIGRSFTDVSRSNPFYRFIETLLHASVTGGCGGAEYCPYSPTARDQMAAFVLVAKEGSGYVPRDCTTPVFGDVPASSPFCRWIEELARRAVVSGCGGGNFCPSAPVTREQMAVFVLRTLDGALNPPACTTPVFSDVPASSPYCRWIEELARRGVATGCGGGNYCPEAAVTREQMSVFLSVTFGLSLYGA